MRLNFRFSLTAAVFMIGGCDLFLHGVGAEGEPCRKNGLCNTGLVCESVVCCVPAVAKQCGADGNIHEFSSCGGEGRVVTTCSACESCNNTSSVTAECNRKPDESACDDGNACTYSDHCNQGVCTATAYSCADDGNPCTDDVCLGDGQCGHIDNTVSCDDGLFCNGADRCVSGTCELGASPCGVFSECDESASACEPLWISAGSSHTCGLATDGRAFCWGSDYYDQLGSAGGSQNSELPVLVDVSGQSPPILFAALAAGWEHTCGVAKDARAFCWGYDDYGQLGNGESSGNSQVPVLVDVSGQSPPAAFTSLTAGSHHTCGVATDGRAFCWGSDEYGQLGNGESSGDSQVPVPVDVSGNSPPVSFTALAAGEYHTCGLATDGRAFCFGRDNTGQLGNGGGSLDSQAPVQVDVSGISPPVSFAALTAGDDHTCGVASDGRAFCWGSDSRGQLGNSGSFDDSQVPVLVDANGISPPVSFTALTAGGEHTCGVATDGRAFCWGGDWTGELGNGGGSQDSQVPGPVDVSGISPPVAFARLTAGSGHTCGIATDGRAFCWGGDWDGQLGNGGSSEESQVPVLVDVSGIP